LLLGATNTNVLTELALKAPKANPTFTGTVSSPQVLFDTASNPPTLTTRSTGTKLVLYPSLTTIAADYAIGVEGSNMWLSVAGDAAGNGFKFYGNTTNVATIKGNGDFACNGAISSASSSTTGNATVGGDLSVTGFLSAKPYISLRIVTTGGTPSTVSGSPATVTVGTPGTVTLTNLGSNTTTVCSRGTVGNGNYLLYTFNWIGAHPLGSNFAANAMFYTTGTASGQPVGAITLVVNSATQITLWIRATVGGISNVLQDGNFYVYSVP
jgi:hypothetical protein